MPMLFCPLALKHNLPYEIMSGGLASAATRLEPLVMNLRQWHRPTVVVCTAHHADDVIESIAINASQGTGWRGLAVMGRGYLRPLINLTKSEIYDYAKEHDLNGVKITLIVNQYLRNRLRQKMLKLQPTNDYYRLYQNQTMVKRQSKRN